MPSPDVVTPTVAPATVAVAPCDVSDVRPPAGWLPPASAVARCMPVRRFAGYRCRIRSSGSCDVEAGFEKALVAGPCAPCARPCFWVPGVWCTGAGWCWARCHLVAAASAADANNSSTATTAYARTVDRDPLLRRRYRRHIHRVHDACGTSETLFGYCRRDARIGERDVRFQLLLLHREHCADHTADVALVDQWMAELFVPVDLVDVSPSDPLPCQEPDLDQVPEQDLNRPFRDLARSAMSRIRTAGSAAITPSTSAWLVNNRHLRSQLNAVIVDGPPSGGAWPASPPRDRPPTRRVMERANAPTSLPGPFPIPAITTVAVAPHCSVHRPIRLPDVPPGEHRSAAKRAAGVPCSRYG